MSTPCLQSEQNHRSHSLLSTQSIHSNSAPSPTLTGLLRNGLTDRFLKELKRGPDQVETERDENGISLLSVACILGEVNVAATILAQAPLLLNEPDKHGLTPLHYAGKINQ